MLQISTPAVNRVKLVAILPIEQEAKVQILDGWHPGMTTMTNVLLVEDGKLLKITAERFLTKSGYNVTTAGDGEEALRMVRASPPDVILLDMLLPKVSGQQVLLALKKDPLTAGIPVIILSGLSQQNEEKLKKDGAVAYFEKAKLIGDVNSGKLNAAIDAAAAERKEGLAKRTASNIA